MAQLRDPINHLPLTFLTSDTIPPPPTRSRFTIDWLPDFGGYSWLAYGASSLLVISHLPSPLSSQQISIGPILRQVFHVSNDTPSPVTSVSWSSLGELAASSGNRVHVFSPTRKGSFCWSQNAVLVQSTDAHTVKWTGSGDGIVAGGVDVVLWRRNRLAWEVAWKFRADQPQKLVSATWSFDGLFATAAGSQCEVQGKGLNGVSNRVLLFYNNGVSEYSKVELHHPCCISTIQWRPLQRRQSESMYSSRNVLLTCCLDGTVRLWTEVDNGKVRKLGKDNNDHKNVKRSFCVLAVIEVNQALNGHLGGDVFLTWGVDISGICKNREGVNHFFSVEGDGHDRVGRCEWLISFGPGTLVSFWAIHCLDDTSPMRFPRITLWKKQELHELEAPYPHKAGFSNLRDWMLLDKVFILRNCLSSPPEVCSLIHILPSNFVVLSSLYAEASNKEGTSLDVGKIGNYLLCSGAGVLNAGHASKILQVAIHPHFYDIQIAASLDSDGSLLFWLISAVSNGNLGLPTWIPSWKLQGNFLTHDSFPKYTSLRWAPPILGDDRMLLMGHATGVDCFTVKISQNSEDVVCCHVCTIPLHHGPYEDGPTNLFAIPLPSTCDKTAQYSKFLLLGIWMKGFRAISWEVTLHSCNSSTSCCEAYSDDEISPLCCKWKFEYTSADRRYFVGVNPCSSQFPELHSADQVTSFSVACPANFLASQEKFGLNGDLCTGLPAYEMATGYSDGTVKLWRCNSSRQSTTDIPWDLVGNFFVHQGPVTTISLTDSGRKIATISKSHLESTTTLHIWESVHLIGTGFFLLEDRIPFDKDIVALNWLNIGNGQLLLGVCFQNELQVYAQKHSDGQILLNSGELSDLSNWSCIAAAHTFTSIGDFLWGPQATPVIIHDNFLRLLGRTVFPLDIRQKVKYHTDLIKEEHDDGKDEGFCLLTFTDCDVNMNSLKKPCAENGNVTDVHASLVLMNETKEYMPSALSIDTAQLKHNSSGLLDSWCLMELVGKLQKPLPFYHPKVLLMNIYSGNSRRAYLSLSHLVEYLTSASEERSNATRCSYVVPQIHLSNYLEGLLVKDSTETGFQWADVRIPSSSSQFFAYDSKSDVFGSVSSSSSRKSDLSSYIEPLEKFHELAALTKVDKLQVLAILDLLGEVQQSASSYETLDEPGRRFWVALRFQQLNYFRSFGRYPSTDELVADARMMCWAFHSDCQEILLSSFLPNESSWNEMRNLGVGFWFTNAAQLRTRMEKLARQQYLRNKDPKDCSVLYIALNRLQVLAGLFKLSRDEKDKPLVGFLSRNFKEEKNKAAALKNAYVLMGRHQLELAVAFFLLGGDAQSAVTVCARNLQDEQLALVICRLVEGHGGPLEQHLITKFMLPSAIETGNYWLASLLEWELGNYLKSFQRMLGPIAASSHDDTAVSSNHIAFVNPHVGLYCLSLATKNSMRNAIGDRNAAILGRWATFVTATSLNRCGLSIEALECLSSSLSMVGVVDQASFADVDHSVVLSGILNPSIGDNPWLTADVALQLESHWKLELALQYFSKLVMEHPLWCENVLGSLQVSRCTKDGEFHQYNNSRGNFQEKFFSAVSKIEQKFAVDSTCIIKMVIVWLWNRGFPFLGYDILADHTSRNELPDESHAVKTTILHPILYKLLWSFTEDITFLLSRFVTFCSIMCVAPEPWYGGNDMSTKAGSTWLNAQKCSFQSILSVLWSLRTAIRAFTGSEDVENLLLILDLFEYWMHFAFAWLQENSKVLSLMIQPLLADRTNVDSPCEVKMADMKNILHHAEKLLACTLVMNDMKEEHKVDKFLSNKHNGEVMHIFSEDEKWYVLGACLWRHMCRFMKNKLHSLCSKPVDCGLSDVLNSKIAFWASLSNTESHSGNLREHINSFALILANFLKATLVHIPSHHLKSLGSFLQQKVENRLHISTLAWLEESSLYQEKSFHQSLGANTTNGKDDLSSLDELWCNFARPNILSEGFEQEKMSWLSFLNNKFSKGWTDVWEDISNEEVGTNSTSNSPSSEEVGTAAKSLFRNGRTFLSSWQKETTITKDFSYFQHAKEVYKRDGELLEALCLNSVNETHAAVASNRKGISFFSWEDEFPCKCSSDYIWSDADWPLNGWAGTESTPVPTCVSPGVGLGNKKGAHLGLGGATIGMATFARPRKNLTGGGAFGVPGYAGIGASGLGWEVQEDFEEFVDSPATAENVCTRAFSSHPSRPLFLVGSSNTHIYLWEFGKNKAVATYGVLPAANVPPPYALASISSLKFDHYGHRFASAALDGTVCTWHLEVGGRSNIRPTESSTCFNGHALDISYIASSGSVIAAAGYSSNSINVVIWDTLAPPTTSRASSICHEGGAHSVSVFDNDIGSGSISPLIVTGGKNGDVGLHDFRYIATGKTKRHRHYENGGASSSVSSNTDLQTGIGTKVGDHNSNGMLWYIPKAHLGSVTKISTIPQTSLFITGSKDGDVKLWDAKTARLVYHWPKLHERRTFIQPSTRGFGGVVRAGVTDIQVVSHGFLTCGGDGSVKLTRCKDFQHLT